VTLAVGGRALVSRQVTRLPAAVRQLHLQHWSRRQAVDSVRERERAMVRDRQAEEAKAREAREALLSPRPLSPSPGRGSPRRRPFATLPTHTYPPTFTAYLNDIESDPRRIGFAYGGTYPGRLHAKGQLVETHKVSFSVGVCGEYWLHVRLRQPNGDAVCAGQDDALPGSPFKLHVAPGPAHPLLTPLPSTLHGSPASLRTKMRAPKMAVECEHLMHACDKMGNRCIVGGASVVCGFLQALPLLSEAADDSAISWNGAASAEGAAGGEAQQAQQVSCTDKGDGGYLLKWTSEEPGSFDVYVKMDGLHVLGSPARLVFPKPPSPRPTAAVQAPPPQSAAPTRHRRPTQEHASFKSDVEGRERRTTAEEASPGAASPEQSFAEKPSEAKPRRRRTMSRELPSGVLEDAVASVDDSRPEPSAQMKP